jgi:hypothetical protein
VRIAAEVFQVDLVNNGHPGGGQRPRRRPGPRAASTPASLASSATHVCREMGSCVRQRKSRTPLDLSGSDNTGARTSQIARNAVTDSVVTGSCDRELPASICLPVPLGMRRLPTSCRTEWMVLGARPPRQSTTTSDELAHRVTGGIAAPARSRSSVTTHDRTRCRDAVRGPMSDSPARLPGACEQLVDRGAGSGRSPGFLNTRAR